MKRLFFMIIPALIYGVMLTSCEKAKQNGQEITRGLYVIGIRSETVSTGEKSNLVFTDNDIISFNVTTGEIVFIDSKVDEILHSVSLYSELNFFIDDKLVFVPFIAIMQLNVDRYCGSPFPWESLNDLGFIILNNETCYLMEGYMPSGLLPTDEREEIMNRQEGNSIKRQEELNVLVELLGKAGKIIE